MRNDISREKRAGNLCPRESNRTRETTTELCRWTTRTSASGELAILWILRFVLQSRWFRRVVSSATAGDCLRLGGFECSGRRRHFKPCTLLFYFCKTFARLSSSSQCIYILWLPNVRVTYGRRYTIITWRIIINYYALGTR